jgi:hypothetical protein
MRIFEYFFVTLITSVALITIFPEKKSCKGIIKIYLCFVSLNGHFH